MGVNGGDARQSQLRQRQMHSRACRLAAGTAASGHNAALCTMAQANRGTACRPHLQVLVVRQAAVHRGVPGVIVHLVAVGHQASKRGACREGGGAGGQGPGLLVDVGGFRRPAQARRT